MAADDDSQLDFLPPRWTTPRRVAVFFAMLLAAVAGSRLYVGRVATHQFAAAEHAARSAGLPWDFADLPPPQTAGRTNAADLYRQAFALKIAGVDSPANSNLDAGRPDPRYSDVWKRLAAASARQYGLMFALARSARAVPDIDWGVRRSAVSISTLYAPLNHLGQARTLANEVADHALYLHFQYDDAGAIDTVDDVIALGRAVDADQGFISHLVALGIHALAFERAAQIALDADFRSPAVARQWRTLLTTLEAEEKIVSSRGRVAFCAEDISGRGVLSIIRGNAWLARPLFDLAAARRSLPYTAAGLADDAAVIPPAPIYAADPFAYVRLPGTPVPLTPPLRPTDILRRLTGYTSDRFVEATRRVVMESRLLRVRIALKLYFADYGRWPASVDALVPAYLTAVPRSPHRPAEARVEFVVLPKNRPDGADRPVVYVDLYHGGNAPEPEPMTGWSAASGTQRGDERGRQWRDVDVWPLAAFASTQPAP